MICSLKFYLQVNLLLSNLSQVQIYANICCRLSCSIVVFLLCCMHQPVGMQNNLFLLYIFIFQFLCSISSVLLVYIYSIVLVLFHFFIFLFLSFPLFGALLFLFSQSLTCNPLSLMSQLSYPFMQFFPDPVSPYPIIHCYSYHHLVCIKWVYRINLALVIFFGISITCFFHCFNLQCMHLYVQSNECLVLVFKPQLSNTRLHLSEFA